MSLIAGDHLYSKAGRFLSPTQWPKSFDWARGKHVSSGGRVFLDISHGGAGACPLGYGDPYIDNAVMRRVASGSYSMLHSPDDEQLADLLVNAPHPTHMWVDKVRFARGGGEAMAVAVRIAQAYTKRRGLMRVAGGYHGWILEDTAGTPSVLATSIEDAIGQVLIAGTYGFGYPAFAPAAVLVDSSVHPDISDLSRVCRRAGVVLIADEVSSGYRGALSAGSIYTGDVHPDLTVMAKGMSNGFPMAVVAGRGDVMDAAEETWLSSTYWTDGVGPAAAIATWERYREADVASRLYRLAEYARGHLVMAADAAGVGVTFDAPHTSLVRWADPVLKDNPAARTYFVEEGLRRGLLVTPGAFYPMLPHTTDDIDRLVDLLAHVWSIGEYDTLAVAEILTVRR